MPSAGLLGPQALQIAQRQMSVYYKVPPISTQQSGGRHTFVLLTQRLVLPNQVFALRLHLLYLIMVLGEGSIQLGM
jgi:hypothetical protein